MDPFQALARNFGFLEDHAADLIRQTAVHTQKRIAGEHGSGRPASRKRDLRAAATHLDGARRALSRLDPRTVVSAIGTLEGIRAIEVSYAPDDAEDNQAAVAAVAVGLAGMRMAEFFDLSERLERLYKALRYLAEGEKVTKVGNPPTSNAVLEGVEALAVLWSRYHVKPISRSENTGEFGLFALTFFQLLEPHPFDSEVRTAVRKLVSQRRNMSPGTSSST